MLQTVTLGLRVLQMILALAIIGLSFSLITEEFCKDYTCMTGLTAIWGHDGLAVVRYSIFMGLYGVVIAAVGTASLFMDSIPLIIPLVGDSIGALFYFAGGIGWAFKLSKLGGSCSDVSEWANKVDPDIWFADDLVGTCRRCVADHGLVWAVFAFTTGLVICDFFRRRYQRQSSN